LYEALSLPLEVHSTELDREHPPIFSAKYCIDLHRYAVRAQLRQTFAAVTLEFERNEIE
jgi:hypothetical protein